MKLTKEILSKMISKIISEKAKSQKLTKSVLEEMIKKQLSEMSGNMYDQYPHDEDEDYEEEECGVGCTEDGWDEEWFEEVGILQKLDSLARVQYEIKNGRRNSYAGIGDNTAEFLQGLMRIAEELNDICEDALNTLEHYER